MWLTSWMQQLIREYELFPTSFQQCARREKRRMEHCLLCAVIAKNLHMFTTLGGLPGCVSSGNSRLPKRPKDCLDLCFQLPHTHTPQTKRRKLMSTAIRAASNHVATNYRKLCQNKRALSLKPGHSLIRLLQQNVTVYKFHLVPSAGVKLGRSSSRHFSGHQRSFLRVALQHPFDGGADWDIFYQAVGGWPMWQAPAHPTFIAGRSFQRCVSMLMYALRRMSRHLDRPSSKA